MDQGSDFECDFRARRIRVRSTSHTNRLRWHLIGMYLIGVMGLYLKGMHLKGMHLMGMHLIGVHAWVS